MQIEEMALKECAEETLNRILALKTTYPQPEQHALQMARSRSPFSDAVDGVRYALFVLEQRIEESANPPADGQSRWMCIEALRKNLILQNGQCELSLQGAYDLLKPYSLRKDQGAALDIFNALGMSSCPERDLNNLFNLIGDKDRQNNDVSKYQFSCPDFGFGDSQNLTTEIYSRAACAAFSEAERQFRHLCTKPIDAKNDFKGAIRNARAWGGYGGRCNPVALDSLEKDMNNLFPNMCKLAARNEILFIIGANFIKGRTNPSTTTLEALLKAAGVTDPKEVLLPVENVGDDMLTREECVKRLNLTVHLFSNALQTNPKYR